MSRIAFDFDVQPDHPCLPGHFPGNPIVPGVLLLDRVFRAIRESTGREVGRVRQARFLSALRPGEAAHASFEVDGLAVAFCVETRRAGGTLVIAEGAVSLSGDAGASAAP